MIKRNWLNIVLVLLLACVITLIVWQTKQRSNRIPDFILGKPFIGKVEARNKVAGNLVSAEVIEIKSSVSGIIEEVFVEVGDTVHIGSPIAKVKPAPEPLEIENARKNLKTAQIEYEITKNDYNRQFSIFKKGGISTSLMEETKSRLEIRELDYKAAQKQLLLLLEGYLNEDQKEINVITSTAKGIITQLPVKNGQSIMKRHTQSEGTTIAIVSSMDKLLFKGRVNEYDIVNLKTGQRLYYTIGAYRDFKCNGKVIRIAPHAIEGQNTVQFHFEATIDFPSDSFDVKTGLTVVAEYITGKTDSVLCVEERFINYQNDSIFVETVDSMNNKNKNIIVPGLSDGTITEVKSGLTIHDKILPLDWE
ncbi:MAG: efflux RND transporter periplasmic adaptor subunit [Prolixibacteraceae bacterium]|nr:efflux RND transporter periplasmic adaptor subunit [Prolixibacteraceae bacterium]